MATRSRGATLTLFAVLFALVAISNFLKPFHLFPNDGFVFLGTKLTGTANAIMGPLFGLLLLIYAYGIWAMRRYALPEAYICAGCVIVNMVLFSMKNRNALSIVSIVVGIGIPLATAIVLSRRSADLT